MAGCRFSVPVRGNINIVSGDQQVATVPFDGEVEAEITPNAARGEDLRIREFTFSLDGKPQAMRYLPWVRAIMGAEHLFNSLIEIDCNLQERLEALAREFHDKNQTTDGAVSPEKKTPV